MKNWKRIILVVFVSIGGTMAFSYWSLNQFEEAFDGLVASPASIVSFVNQPAIISETSNFGTSTSETGTFGTSTPELDISGTSTPPIDQDDLDPNFQLIFSPENNDVYVGCTYEISWSASTTIKFLETALVDAGTRKPIGPKASGLAKENNIEVNLQNLKWKVEMVWPGEYFISILKVNGVITDERSKKFMINNMPNELPEKDQENLCKGTGGSLF